MTTTMITMWNKSSDRLRRVLKREAFARENELYE